MYRSFENIQLEAIEFLIHFYDLKKYNTSTLPFWAKAQTKS